MKVNVVGPFKVNHPFATEIAFSKGLRAIGHEVVEFDPNVDSPDVLDRQADFTLVFKNALGHNRVLHDMPRVVVYQPDDLRFPHIREMVTEMREYSPHLIVFRKYGELPPEAEAYSTVHTLPVTADPDIYYPEHMEKDFDFCFIGSMGNPQTHWQRIRMITALSEAGYKVLYGETKDVDLIRRSYCRSRVVINHASDQFLPFGTGYGYQCRHFEAAMTRSCLLSNTIRDDDKPLLWNFYRFYSMESFLSAAQELVNDEALRNKLSEDLYDEVMSGHYPTDRARELVQILESL